MSNSGTHVELFSEDFNFLCKIEGHYKPLAFGGGIWYHIHVSPKDYTVLDGGIETTYRSLRAAGFSTGEQPGARGLRGVRKLTRADVRESAYERLS